GTEKTASSESAHLNKQSQWDKFEAAGVVPKGTEFVKICCFLTGSKGSIGTVYFDDLQLKINTSTQ
ncbi:MAG: hypothetical protein U9Q21_03575, partial [Candidatus Auribacterota bacterium]|nr:hypothetical protein [Candidatus Auribacterota bacterium]